MSVFPPRIKDSEQRAWYQRGLRAHEERGLRYPPSYLCNPNVPELHPFRDAWLAGWDYGETLSIIGKASAAPRDAKNPYPDDPQRAAAWVYGWRTEHDLEIVRKAPTQRLEPATPDNVSMSNKSS